MKEVWLGSENDQRYIKVYLDNIRQLDPIEISMVPNPIHLGSPVIEEVLDVQLFWDTVNWCIKECERRYSVRVSIIDPMRYYIGRLPVIDDMGGFHNRYGLGYQYWYHAGFVIVLNSPFVSKKLRTIELARGFLHDCLHHSTFRSFRRAIRLPAESLQVAKHRVPEIYREQYGINFRDQDGNSYSSSGLTAQSPQTINLNILMDGVIVLIIAELLKECVGASLLFKNALEEEIMKEIFLEPFNQSILARAHAFHHSVTEPSRLFIEYWGGQTLASLILESMMDGEIGRLKKFFDEKTGELNAWEKKFKHLDFCSSVDPKV